MITEIKNIVDKPIQDAIESFIQTTNFPWFYGDVITEYALGKEDEQFVLKQGSNPYHFTHNVVVDSKNNSEFFGLVQPLIEAAASHLQKDIQVIRARFNFVPQSTDPSHHYPHVDIGTYKDSGVNIVSMIYYVNDSDGDTYFFDDTGPTDRTSLNIKQQVSPCKGTAIIFNSNIFHSGSSPVNTDKRMVFNAVFKILE